MAGEEDLEPASDIELEYDEQASIDEFEDSGSEFQVSDDEVAAELVEDDDVESDAENELQAYAEALQEDGIDAEDILMSAAIKDSLESARNDRSAQEGQSSSGAGSSSSSRKPTAAAALRAAAAERRVAQLKKGRKVDVDDDYEEEAQITDNEVSAESSDDEAAPKGKGKVKAKAQTPKKAVKPADTSKPKSMTMKEWRAKRREEKKKERLERKKRRGLTQVRYPAAAMIQCGLTSTQAERNKIDLEQHHPELKDVWGDVERHVPVNVPVKAEQPPGLKVTLLPFQQESLHWFKQQEQTVWHGGMLADEMGYAFRSWYTHGEA